MLAANFIILLVNLVFGFIELVLGFRILLKFLGANPNTPFVTWIYETSQPLLQPFENIFPTARLTGGFILEISTLFALIVYGLIGYLILELVRYLAGETVIEE